MNSLTEKTDNEKSLLTSILCFCKGCSLQDTVLSVSMSLPSCWDLQEIQPMQHGETEGQRLVNLC